MRKSVDVATVLCLKVGAPVMLTVNMSQRLVNGLTGVVKCLNDDSVDVYFTLLKDTVTIPYHPFFQYDCKNEKHVFVMKQLPLILCFAMTIHKSQGMTMRSVLLDCDGAFEPGQISVGLGRVMEPCQITVKNFRPGLCPPHSPKINEYYGVESVPFNVDLTCCQNCFNNNIATSALPQDSGDCDSPSSDSDYSDDDSCGGNVSDDQEEGAAPGPSGPPLEFQENTPFPSFIDCEQFRDSLKIESPFCDMHHTVNEAIDEVSYDSMRKWIYLVYCKLHSIYDAPLMSKNINKSINSAVHQFVHVFSTSDEFMDNLKQLFGVNSLEEHHLSVGVSCLLKLQDFFYHNMSQTPTHMNSQQRSNINAPSEAKIRYVGGMCVAKVLYKDTTYHCSNIHKDSTAANNKKKIVMTLLKHTYTSMTIAQKETERPDTLSEISHRLRKFGHLTIVDDTLLNIFVELDRLLYPQLTSHNLTSKRNDLFHEIIDNCIDSIFTESDLIIPPELTPQILYPVFCRYVKVSMKEFGFRIMSSHNVSRKLAHRKQVLLEESGPLPKRPRTDGDSEVSSIIPQPQPDADVEEAPSTSGDTQQWLCSICSVPYKQKSRLLWIECSFCEQWLHKKCDKSLKVQKVWLHMSSEGVQYKCLKCSSAVTILFSLISMEHHYISKINARCTDVPLSYYWKGYLLFTYFSWLETFSNAHSMTGLVKSHRRLPSSIWAFAPTQ